MKKGELYDFGTRVNDMFNAIGENGDKVKEILKAKDIIAEIAENAMKTPVFIDGKPNFDTFVKEMRENFKDKEDRLLAAWVHFLRSASHAPTSLHRRTVILLCIPVVNEAIKDYEKISNTHKSKVNKKKPGRRKL